MTDSGHRSETGLTVYRIETLTDGIFTFAMTLLVLSIDIPQKRSLTAVGLHKLLLGQFQEFFNYALSFILLAIFWMTHHQQFHFIRRTNHKHLWINIMILMFIALVPFSTSLVGDFPNEWMAELFFGSNMFILGILFYVNWAYATRGRRLVDPDLDSAQITLGKKKITVFPLVSILAIILALTYPRLSSFAYLLVPVILSFSYFNGKKHRLRYPS